MYAIIPLAGFGSRFERSAWKVPKPLIQVDKKPMFYYSVASLPLANFSEIIFIIRDDGDKVRLVNSIQREFSNLPISFQTLSEPTRGQAETVYLATSHIPSEEPIVIHNGDTAFSANFTQSFFHENSLLLFNDTDPRWSFAKLKENGEVTQTAEKTQISEFASTGTYTFENNKVFRKNYEEHQKSFLGEHYIAPIYNRIIQRGGIVNSLIAKEIYCMGTPDDLNVTMEKINNWRPNEQIF